jgi:hypothetical protein
MATKLDKTIKRELEIDGRTFTVLISPDGVKVTPKGGRTGHETSWRSLAGVGGTGAAAVAGDMGA